MTALISALDSALLHFVWQGVAVAIVLWVILAALRKAAASARYLVSCAALALLVAMPVATAWRAFFQHAAQQAPALAMVTVSARFSPTGASSIDWLAMAQAWLAPVWACGVLLLSLRMLWGCAKVSRLKRQGEAADEVVLATVARLAARIRTARPIRVVISTLADSPSVVGWLKPVLLLPSASILGLTPDQLEAVLAHELAHIRRYDYLVNMIQMLIETLFFYHPAVWWISRRIREERELCCDDIAVQTCGDAVCYARALTALEKMRVLSPGLALGANGDPLRYRIERLLGLARPEPAPSRLPGMIAICLGLACLAPSPHLVKAQAPLPPAPLPAPAIVTVSKPNVAPHRLAQVISPRVPVPAPAAAEAYNDESVMVDVTIDRNGDVEDAHVVSGRLELRRYALQRALNMHFPQDGPPRQMIAVPVTTPPFDLAAAAGIRPVRSAAEAQESISTANAAIIRLQNQQADASVRGAAQLQEVIDRNKETIAKMQAIAAGENPLIGKKVETIRISGYITDDARGQLLAKIPLRLHDELTANSMDAAIRAVQQAYPGAQAYFGTFGLDDGGFAVVVPMPRTAVR